MDEATLQTLGNPAATPLALARPWLGNLRNTPRIPTRMGLHDHITIASHDGNMQWSAILLDVSAGGIGASRDQGSISHGTYDVRFPLGLQGEAQMVNARMKLVYCVRQGYFGSHRIGFQLLSRCRTHESSVAPVFDSAEPLTDRLVAERRRNMDISTFTRKQTVTIALSGRLNFQIDQRFREACETALKRPDIKELNLDLTRVDCLDSSALGSLLAVRQRAAANNRRVSLSGCKGTVKQALDLANFGRLFEIK